MNNNQNNGILKNIQQKKVHPIYLLCGEEKFILEETLKRMLSLLLDDSTRDFNLSLLDGNTSTREILTQIEMYPVISNWRVVVVRDPQFLKNTKKEDPSILIEKAIALENTDNEKCINIMTEILGVGIEDILYQSPDYTKSVESLIQELEDNNIRLFCNRLSQIAQDVDNSNLSGVVVDDIENLTRWLQGSLPKQSVLILVINGSVDKRGRLVKLIQQKGYYHSFDPIDENKAVASQKDSLYHKIVTKFSQNNKKITNKAIQELRGRNNGNLYAIAECIKKILALCEDSDEITDKDVIQVVTQNQYNNIFDLTDAIGAKSIDNALKSLYDVIITGEPAIKINALIIRQFRLAFQARSLLNKEGLKPITNRTTYATFNNKVFKILANKYIDILPEDKSINVLKQHPFAAYKVFQTASVFSEDELISALDKVLEVDKQLKLSTLEPDCILEQLVCDLCEV